MPSRCHINRSVKVLPIRRFLKGFQDEYIQYIGIAADEPERLARLDSSKISLLAKYGYTERMAYDLCKKYGLLSPVYDFASRNGCWFCPNARKGQLEHLRNDYPDLWNKLLELECMPDLIGNKFNTLTKTSVHDIEKNFFLQEPMTLAESFLFDTFE